MKILIIGGGFAGCASAEILSHLKKSQITLVEKSSILGAGVRTFFYGGHPFTYGPRLLITKRKETFNYLKKFLKFRNLNYHQFKSYVEQDDKFYNYPLNQKDIAIMPDKKKIFKELKDKKKYISAKNLEEFWIKSVGKTLFEKTIKNYNKKMWMVDSCTELDTFNWSPKGHTIKSGKRAAYDNDISAAPAHIDGYNKYFDVIPKIKNLKLKMNSEVKNIDMKNKTYYINSKKYTFDILINTISPDTLFNKKFGELKFIGRDLIKMVFPVKEVFPKDVVFLYYPNSENFTRLVEYKKITKHKSNTSLIGMEIPSKNGKFYPLPIKSEQKKAQKYFNNFKHNCFSIGRAGTYSYLVDIDDSIYQALEIKKIIENNSWDGPIVGEEFKFKL